MTRWTVRKRKSSLFPLSIGSVATMQRRLRRLKQAGAIQYRRSKSDGRAVELLLAPKLQRIYARYAELLGLG